MRKMFNENLHMCLLGILSSSVEEMTLWLKVTLHMKKNILANVMILFFKKSFLE